HAHEAGAANLVPQRVVFLLPAPLDGGHQIEPRALGEGQDFLDDLIGRLRADRNVTIGTVRLAEAGVQNAQVIVDFGDRAHGRARALAGGLLLDADGRRQAADVLDLRLLYLPQELPGVSRQRFDVAPLPLGVHGVQGERALAGAAGAATNRHRLARHRHADVFQ